METFLESRSNQENDDLEKVMKINKEEPVMEEKDEDDVELKREILMKAMEYNKKKLSDEMEF